MVYIIDTHALVWFLESNTKLSEMAKAILADPEAQLVIPSIVLAETAHLYARKRISVDAQKILKKIASADNCTVYPLDEQVALTVSGSLDIHDAIIVATAMIYRDTLKEDVAIVTNDQRITTSGLVKTVW